MNVREEKKYTDEQAVAGNVSEQSNRKHLSEDPEMTQSADPKKQFAQKGKKVDADPSKEEGKPA